MYYCIRYTSKNKWIKFKSLCPSLMYYMHTTVERVSQVLVFKKKREK